MANGLPDQMQRWTVKRGVALILSILKGECGAGGPEAWPIGGEIGLVAAFWGRRRTLRTSAGAGDDQDALGCMLRNRFR